MATIADAQVYTPEDLLVLENSINYELVAGQLVERSVGSESGWIGAGIIGLLWSFCSNQRRGHVLSPESSYQCYSDHPQKVRKPDVSFIRFGRLEGERIPIGHIPIPPDLVVEIIPPGDLFEAVELRAFQSFGS